MKRADAGHPRTIRAEQEAAEEMLANLMNENHVPPLSVFRIVTRGGERTHITHGIHTHTHKHSHRLTGQERLSNTTRVLTSDLLRASHGGPPTLSSD
jgi:hypothetical protein